MLSFIYEVLNDLEFGRSKFLQVESVWCVHACMEGRLRSRLYSHQNYMNPNTLLLHSSSPCFEICYPWTYACTLPAGIRVFLTFYLNNTLKMKRKKA